MNQHAQTFSLLKCISSTLGLSSPALDLCSFVSLAAHADVQARVLSFCIRSNILPPVIRALFGGFPPSHNHGTRLCKILRSEWRRQARFYRDCLHSSIFSDDNLGRARQRWREFSRLLDQSAEACWTNVLGGLRRLVPRKKDAGNSYRIHCDGDIDLPEDVSSTLKLGPKFAVQPKRDAAELLTCVREVAKRVPEDDSVSCVAHGVNVVAKCGRQRSDVRLQRVATSLKDLGLCVLPADKEGGFAVLRHESFRAKANEAVLAVFKSDRKVSLKKVKCRAKQLCEQLNLMKTVKQIESSDNVSLEMFFSAKTHKMGCPFRVIVSEAGTWQRCVACHVLE